MRGFRDGGSLGAAGGLEGFEVLHAAFDGAFDGGFVAGEAGEVVGALALCHESAGEEIFRFVGIGRVGVFPVAFHVEFVIRLSFPVEADQNGGFLAVDAGFEGKGTVETPLGGGDAFDGQFFAVADGAEVVVEILEEAEEGFGILTFEDEVFVAGEAVGEAVRLEATLPSGVRGGWFSWRCGGWIPPAVGKRDRFSLILWARVWPFLSISG